MTWVGDNLGLIWEQLREHLYLAIVPVILGLLISVPLGYVATRYSWLANPLIAFGGVLYSLPSIALFIVLPAVLGTKVLSTVNIIVALTIYTVVAADPQRDRRTALRAARRPAVGDRGRVRRRCTG